MFQVLVEVADGPHTLGADGAALEEAVDADIAKFNEYFQRELKNDPLIKSEIAMLKTYLWWKTHQEKSDAG
jgi:hypothetical protein